MVTNDIQNFAAFWPRSDRPGVAQYYAFQCADILELNCETIAVARNAKPYFVAVMNANDEPLALFPLSIEYQNNIRILMFLDGGLSDNNAPVVFPPVREWDKDVVRAVWRCLRKVLPFDIAVLEKMPTLIGDLPNPLSFISTSNFGMSCHLITLSGTWEDLSARFPRRKELRRKATRLGQRGRIHFEVAETLEQYDLIVEALISQKTRRSLEVRGTDDLDCPGYRAYLRAAGRIVYPSGPVCLFALKVNNTIIATQWGYLVGRRFYALMPSFETGEWSAYSPGHLLADNILEWCISKGLDVFDYGIGDEGYKREYSDVSSELYRADIPSTVRGRIVLSTRGIKQRFVKTRLGRLALAIRQRLRNKWRL
jgi:CelD/BcsL family acetyltransferase involved in cellulose biosynthesis